VKAWQGKGQNIGRGAETKGFGVEPKILKKHTSKIWPFCKDQKKQNNSMGGRCSPPAIGEKILGEYPHCDTNLGILKRNWKVKRTNRVAKGRSVFGGRTKQDRREGGKRKKAVLWGRAGTR